MSQQAIEQFLEAAARNEVLLAKLATADSASSVVKIAAELGYELTENELAAVAEQMRLAPSSEELSDDELEAISGGFVIVSAAATNNYLMSHDKGCKW